MRGQVSHCPGTLFGRQPPGHRAARADPNSDPSGYGSQEIREWFEQADTMPRGCFAAQMRVNDRHNGRLCIRWHQTTESDTERRALFGRLIGYLGSALRLGAQLKELHETIDTLSAVVDRLPVGVLVLNPDARSPCVRIDVASNEKSHPGAIGD